MNYLTAENLTKSFGEKLLFENISFGIDAGQKIALIAKNGAGKSSLIKILVGEDVPDIGKITLNNETKISYLSQNPSLTFSETIIDFLFESDNPQLRLIREYEYLLNKLKNSNNAKNRRELENVIGKMDELSAWNYESKIREILGKFNIHDLSKKIGGLSGGSRKKIALAKALIEEANLLILDEPTNHLDIEMIEWLEHYLDRQQLSLFLVTHDRYFLDNVCNRIFELDNQSLYKYKGNYTWFLEKKAERETIEATGLERDKQRYKKELEWMQRQPQARATKAKARIDTFYELKDKINRHTKESTTDFGIQMKRLGGKILELNNIYKSYDDDIVLEDFTYIFKKGDRIGVVGNNGTGKSTLLKIITGEVKPDKGKVITGQTVVFGYFEQEGLPLSQDKRIIEIIKDIAEEVKMGKKSLSSAQFLSYFNFHPDIHYNYYSSLSGGEKRKLYLLTTLLQNPNFLILDEPTNDLDIFTLNRLEEFLQDFQGCLVIVSHDRYFMDNMVDHIFAFKGNGKIKDYYGNYSEYYRQKSLAKKVVKTDKKKEKKFSEKPLLKSTRPTYKQKKEFAQLEKEIASLENEKEEVMKKLNSGEGSHEELQTLSERFSEISILIDEKSDRWLELSEIIEFKE